MSSTKSASVIEVGKYNLGTGPVARIGYGAMQLQRFVGDAAGAMSVLRRAVELGIDHIDTADFYGGGFVNKVVGNIAREERHIVVATKIGAAHNPGGRVSIRPAQRPEELRAGIEENLKSLGTDCLDLVNLRRLDVGPGISAEGDQVVDLDDQMAEMISMRDEGKIGAIGLSAVDVEGLKRALPAGIACVQNAYSVLSRRYESMLNLCVDAGIAWVPFFPLGGAHFPEWPKVTEEPTVIEIAARTGATPSQVGLAWLLAHKPNILLIPGTASISHLEENSASASIDLDEDALSELDSIGDQT